MELEPLQKPHPPLWYGVHSPESAERAARRALNIVSLDPAVPTRSFTDRFREVWREVHAGAVTRPCPRSALAASWWWPTMTKRRFASPGAPTPSGTGASTTCSGSGEARQRINVPRTSTASSPPARGSPAVRTRSGRSCGHSSIRPAPTISSGSSPSATSPSTRPFVPWISFRSWWCRVWAKRGVSGGQRRAGTGGFETRPYIGCPVPAGRSDAGFGRSVVSHKYAYESAGRFWPVGCVRSSVAWCTPLLVPAAPCRQPKCPRIFITVFVRHHTSSLRLQDDHGTI